MKINISIDLTDEDSRKIQKIIDSRHDVHTTEGALVWAIRNVPIPEPFGGIVIRVSILDQEPKKDERDWNQIIEPQISKLAPIEGPLRDLLNLEFCEELKLQPVKAEIVTHPYREYCYKGSCIVPFRLP